MVLLRVQVKFFAANPEAVDLHAMIGIFQRWIQQKSVPGLLIDVADYAHVPEGPGVVLIGHEVDYGLDLTGGQPGLLYTRKRRVDSSLQEQLRQSFTGALAAVQLLEAETALRFRTDEVELRFADRLLLPNQPDSLNVVQPDIQAVLAENFGDAAANFTVTSTDPREVFTVRVQLAQVASLAGR